MMKLNIRVDPLFSYWELLKCSNKDEVLLRIAAFIETGSGMTISEFRKCYSEERCVYEALRYVCTTKKSIVKTIGLELDNSCRYKRKFEKLGSIMQTNIDYRCPYTGYPARLLTSNPDHFTFFQNDFRGQLDIQF